MGTPAIRSDRRKAIVGAAIARIARDGLEGLRIRDVAADAGIHHATLLHHHPTKEDLIRAVVDALVEDFSAIGIAPLDGDPLTRLRAHHAAIRARIDATPEVFVVFNELSTRAQRDPAIAEALRPTVDGWAAFLRSIAEAAAARGALPARFDTEAWIELEMATVKGLCVRLGEAGCLLGHAPLRGRMLERSKGMFELLESLFPGSRLER